MLRIFFAFFIFLFIVLGSGCSAIPKPQSMPMKDLSGSKNYSVPVKKLVAESLLLSKKGLDYHYGSANPTRGGMDCSGTIHYLLKKVAHIDSPRTASDLYLWVKKKGRLHAVHTYSLRSIQFNYLEAGDLLFWTGTYRTHRKPPITHVMLYLGRDKHHRPRMFGASEGISNGRVAKGVGVFEFILPYPGDTAHFVAYGCIPSYTC